MPIATTPQQPLRATRLPKHDLVSDFSGKWMPREDYRKNVISIG
ncbi:MAG: hypothetical protein P4L92_17270 [Rudaea sp.]|nr:hypothetical protein [Rudaea sp.]